MIKRSSIFQTQTDSVIIQPTTQNLQHTATKICEQIELEAAKGNDDTLYFAISSKISCLKRLFTTSWNFELPKEIVKIIPHKWR